MSVLTPLRVRLPFGSEEEFAAEYGSHVGKRRLLPRHPGAQGGGEPAALRPGAHRGRVGAPRRGDGGAHPCRRAAGDDHPLPPPRCRGDGPGGAHRRRPRASRGEPSADLVSTGWPHRGRASPRRAARDLGPAQCLGPSGGTGAGAPRSAVPPPAEPSTVEAEDVESVPEEVPRARCWWWATSRSRGAARSTTARPPGRAAHPSGQPSRPGRGHPRRPGRRGASAANRRPRGSERCGRPDGRSRPARP